MTITPYKPSKAAVILKARSVWTPGNHGYESVTAYVVEDKPTKSKNLLTYKCNREWLRQTIPDIVISNMPRNDIEPLKFPIALNADVMPNDIQASATQAVIENNFKTCFFNIPTGVGKTLLAIYLAGLLNVKVWIMCYRTAVLSQWVKTMEEKTTTDTKRVKIISSSKDLLKMAEGTFDYDDYDVYLSTPMILTSFAKREGIFMLNDVFNNCGIGAKFFDEAHYNIGNITKINALTNVDRTYYLSADFGPVEPNKSRLYTKMFGSVPIIRPKDDYARDMRYTNAIVAHYNTNPSINSVESAFTTYGFNHNRYMEYQMTQRHFFEALEHVLSTVIKSDPDGKYKILILCTLIEHVDRFKEWVEEFYAKNMPEDQIPKIVRYHSQMPEDEREDALNNGEVIVSTYQSMGVGMDLKMIRYVLALSPVSSLEDNQAAGRARALPDGSDCFYFMFVDDGFAYVRKKLPERLAYLQKQKVKQIYSIRYS